MRSLALIVPPRSYRAGIGALLDLCRLTNRYAASLFADVEQTQADEPRLLSIDGGAVRGADGREVAVDGALEGGRVYDGAFVAAFEADEGAAFEAQLAKMAPIYPWLRAQHERGAAIVAGGSALFILAEAGLLRGGRSAAPAQMEGLFRRRYPQVTVDLEQTVVKWGSVMTAAAMGAEPVLALRLLEAVHSPNLANVLAKLTHIEGPVDPQSDHAFSREILLDDPLVARAQHALQPQFSHRPSLETLAADMGVSQRTLLRRFRSTVGMTPMAYLQHVRIESAKQMLAKSSRPIERIAYMVGYGDLGYFNDIFRRRVGTSPAQFRRQARDEGPS